MRLAHIFLLMVYSRSQVFAQTTSTSLSTSIHSISAQTGSVEPTRTTHDPSLHQSTSAFIYGSHTFATPAIVTVTRTGPIVPTFTKDRPPGSRGRPSKGHRESRQQKPIIIFFEVLCGVIIFGILVCLLRCCYSYKRTPSHDRVMGVVNRYRLQQELEDLERNPLARRRASIDDPVPPYLPRPPSYISFIEPTMPVPTAQASAGNYAEVSTISPPGSPVIRRASLEVLIPQASHPPNPPNG